MSTPRRRSPSSLRLACAAVLLAMLALLGGACGGSEAGSGYGISGDDLRATTTTTVDPNITTIATATVPVLEVFTDIPAEPGATSTTIGAQAEPASFRTPAISSGSGAQPIPRESLNSAGSAKTATGYTFDNPTYYEKPLVLVVTAVEGDWVKVLLPARPNGTEGWVRASDVTLSEHDFHGTLDISDRHLTVWEGDTLVADTAVVVGKDNTPTPLGHIYISEVLTAADAGVSPGGAYGPNILPTNAYSEALDMFDGGLPVVAFHGTNQPDLIGTAASNGCIRMPNEIITLLAETIPAGTPVDVVE